MRHGSFGSDLNSTRVMDLTTRTRFEALAIGTVAASLILWLSISFWLDAWHQRVDAYQLQRAHELDSALLAVAHDVALERETVLSQYARSTSFHGLAAKAQLDELRHRIEHGLDDVLASVDAILDETVFVDRLRHSTVAIRASIDSIEATRLQLAGEHESITSSMNPIAGDSPVSQNPVPPLRRAIGRSSHLIERIGALQDLLIIVPRDHLPSISDLHQLQTDLQDFTEQAALTYSLTEALSSPLLVSKQAAIRHLARMRSSALRELGAASNLLAQRTLEDRLDASVLVELDALVSTPQAALSVAATTRQLHSHAITLTRQIGEQIAEASALVAAHAYRRLAIDTLLIIACFWIVLTSLRIIGNINRQAWHDRLTGLPNRLRFEQMLSTAIQRSRQRNELLGVIVFDIDHFRAINDEFGHGTGDTLLQHLPARVSEFLEPDCCISAFGGDLFAVITPALASTTDAASVARRILLACTEHFNAEGASFCITLSIGVSVSDSADLPTDGDGKARELVRRAEIAMRQAKDEGRDRVRIFDATLAENARERIRIERDLRQAVDAEQLELHYQPKISIDTAHVEGMEALVRWNHPTQGMISPASFIPIAERSGLIVPIGSWVLDESVRQTALWHRDGLDKLHIAVNVSAEQFVSDDFVEEVMQVLARHSLPAHCLELEITESVGMQDLSIVVETLERLRALGVSIAIDDFGTDYSSLQYLEDLPVDTLKIDRAFIRKLDGGEGPSVARAIVLIARSLDLRTVAEGVETETQLDQVTAIGCDCIQGYYYSRPVPAAGFVATLQSIEARLAANIRRIA